MIICYFGLAVRFIYKCCMPFFEQMRYLLIIILTIKFSVTYSQERTGHLTNKEILRNKKVILRLVTFMVETRTARLMYDSLDDDDILKKRMKKLGVDYIRMRYTRNDFDPGDSTVRLKRPLKDIYRDCAEEIIYDFSSHGQNYPDKSDDKSEFKRMTDRIYYRKNCDVHVHRRH
jgi:hypothetical protein